MEIEVEYFSSSEMWRYELFMIEAGTDNTFAVSTYRHYEVTVKEFVNEILPELVDKAVDLGKRFTPSKHPLAFHIRYRD